MAKRGTLTVRVVGETNKLEKSLSSLGGKFAGFAGAAAKAGLAVGGALTGIGVFAVKTFADFDSAMTKSLAIMGDVSGAMRQDMSAAAREVGKTTTFSAEQAAESYFFLASAGFDAKQAIAALPQVAAFAQAGMFDMATATDLATDAQSALGIKSDDARQNLKNLTRVTDVLVKANVLANATVEQFSESLTNKAGAALKVVGKDIEEGVAVLAAFADQGVKGAEAGTALNIVFRDLQTKALKNTERFEDLGVAVFDAQGDMRNIADILGDLEGALDGASDAQAKATLLQLGFTDKSVSFVQALLGSSDAIRTYERDLRSASGTTKEVADNQLESFSAKMSLVWDKIKDVAISIGTALEPALDAFADWLDTNLGPITRWFDRVSQKFLDFLGISEETSEGVVSNITDLGIGVRTQLDGLVTRFGLVPPAVDGVEQSFSGMTRTAGREFAAARAHVDEFHDGLEQRFGRDIPKHLDGLEVRFGGMTTTVEDETDLMGQAFHRIHEAWSEIWQTEVVPWFTGTAIPFAKWAGAEMGVNLANGLIGVMVDLLPQMQKKIIEIFSSLMPFGDAASLFKNVELPKGSDVEFITNPVTKPGQELPTTGELQLGRFHTGGQVGPGETRLPGMAPNERVIAVEVGERVLAEGRSGNTINLTQQFFGNDPHRSAQESVVGMKFAMLGVA